MPIPPRPQKKRDWAKILKLAGITNTLPPAGGKAGPAAQPREDEGENILESAPATDTESDALRAPPLLNPPPVGGRTSESDAAPEAPDPQTHQTGEALKQPAPATLDEVPTDEIVALYLARRRHWKLGTAPPPDRLGAFSYDALMYAARSRLSARVLNRKILEDDGATQRPLTRAERQWRTPLHVLMKDKGVVY